MDQYTSMDISAETKGLREEMRLTMKLGWPVILSNLTQIFLPIIDGVMVGSIHSNQLAAASLVVNILTIPVILCMGLPMALSPLVSASLGKSDLEAPFRLLINGMFVGGMFSFLLALIFHLGSDIVFHLGQDIEVAQLSQSYLVISGWRLVPMMLFIALTNFAEGLGRTKMVMVINFIALPINVFLNYILIFGHWGMPALGLTGAGYGTLLTHVIILSLFIIYILSSKSFLSYRKDIRKSFKLKTSIIRDILRIGIPTGFQYSFESGAFAFSGLMAGWLGAEQQAAHQIGLYISSLSYMVILGICTAGTIRLAFYFGKEDWDLLRAIGRSTLVLAFSVGIIFSFFLVTGYSFIPRLFVSEIEVIQYAKMVLFMVAIFQLSDAIQSTSSGLLLGIQDVKVPAYLALIAYWAIGIPFGYFFAFYMEWGVTGLWMGLILGLSANAILLTIRFFRKVDKLSKKELTKA